MVKIKDIALACHTSSATVSKALHNSPELSKETIVKIQKAAKQMGYVPNAYARALKMKHSNSIGIIYDDPSGFGLSHECFSNVIQALKAEAERQGYAITFLSRNPKMPTTSYLSLAQYWNMDGVIIVSENFSDPDIVELVNSGLPVVTIDYIFNSCTAVMSDNAEGMEKLVNFIIGRGHRQIAFVHGETTDVTQKRLSGYYKALKDSHIAVNPLYLKNAIFHGPRESGRATIELLHLKEKPTCICYPDDVSMLGGITALQQAGYTIGEDISIAGYDGVEISRIYRPTFTTYQQNFTDLGTEAAKYLIERIDNPTLFTPQKIVVSGAVQEGQTVKDINS